MNDSATYFPICHFGDYYYFIHVIASAQVNIVKSQKKLDLSTGQNIYSALLQSS